MPESVIPPPNYIDLRRTFAPVAKEAAAEDSAVQSYAGTSNWLSRRDALAWDDLLKHSLTVLLGEPGSGKTFELQYQATLSSPGCPRFYFRLDELAAVGEQFRLFRDDARRIAEWRESQDNAIFLLDSVDEAKIRQATDFYRALDCFLELIGRRALSRATIIISSRITEWLPTTDGHELRVRFPHQGGRTVKSQKEGRSEEDLHPFVVQLLPLDEAAVTTYANSRGVADAQRFLEALEKAHAWELARRPADVNDLLAFWRETGSLGTLTEILGFLCDSQLRKTSDRERSEVLNLARARSGAECLAAATVLCRKFAFQIPGETSSAAHAIDALASLPPDWRNEEVRALLNHALFDGASYGHIRFHHRRLSEFLAARWFDHLMVQGCPVGELEDLLFEVRGAERVLRPSLAPLAAWLSAGGSRWNMMVCRRVIEVAPEILLRYGDPAMLAVEDRRALLKALSKKADGREYLWWEHDEATLSRLSDPALAEEINELLAAPASGRTLREIALQIVIAGRLAECAPAVLQSAITDLTTGEVFPTAVRALKVVCSDSDLWALATAAENAGQFPERVCVPLCGLLFPRIWSVSQLFHALDKMQPTARRGIGWDYTLSGFLASGTNKASGLPLLKGLLGRAIDDGDEFEMPSSVRAALAISSVMLDWSVISDQEAAAIAEVLIRVDSRRSYVSREDSLPERTERHLKVREQYFQRAAERLMKEHGVSDPRVSSIVIYYEWIQPTAGDQRWILRWLESAGSERERESALWWALDVWQQTGRSRADLLRIKRAAKPFPQIRKLLWKYFHPGIVARTKAIWYRRIRYRFYRHSFRMIWRGSNKPYVKFRDAWNLWRHREKMRSGEYVGWLSNLASEACGESRDQWSPSDWSLLVKKRGAKCATAVKEGCRRVWERYQPPLPHERKPNEGVTYGTLAGLAGIKVAWQEGQLSFAKLSLDDARRATRYALSELNGFTPWFDDLIRAQPQAVQSVLTECIAGEWEIPTDSEHHHLVLYDLAWTESVAGDLIKPALVERLSDSEPKNSHVLQDALCILTAPPSRQRAELAALAALRASAVPVCGPSFPQWLALWLQTDALPALDSLESRLSSATDPNRAITVICANLSSRAGYRLPLLTNPSWLTPAALRRFIPLVYRYIRREDDIGRSGGEGYSPTARDDAQDFRNGLLERVVALKDPEVGAVLQELLSEPLLAHLSDYMRHLLEKHREQLSEGPPWRASDVRKFAITYERDPQTDAELFKIGVRRLLDLKRWVELGEDSPRKEVHPADKEAGFRDWLRRRLNENPRGYIVPPEWEIVGGRPDLRLAMSGAAPVSLELKIADNWNLQELLDGLESQLVGTYLRDDRSRYGIYILALFKRDRTWEPPGQGPRIDSEQMLNFIRTRIAEILAARADIAGLEVVVIHFSPPAP